MKKFELTLLPQKTCLYCLYPYVNAIATPPLITLEYNFLYSKLNMIQFFSYETRCLILFLDIAAYNVFYTEIKFIFLFSLYMGFRILQRTDLVQVVISVILLLFAQDGSTLSESEVLTNFAIQTNSSLIFNNHILLENS